MSSHSNPTISIGLMPPNRARLKIASQSAVGQTFKTHAPCSGVMNRCRASFGVSCRSFILANGLTDTWPRSTAAVKNSLAFRQWVLTVLGPRPPTAPRSTRNAATSSDVIEPISRDVPKKASSFCLVWVRFLIVVGASSCVFCLMYSATKSVSVNRCETSPGLMSPNRSSFERSPSSTPPTQAAVSGGIETLAASVMTRVRHHLEVVDIDRLQLVRQRLKDVAVVMSLDEFGRLRAEVSLFMGRARQRGSQENSFFQINLGFTSCSPFSNPEPFN